jgi:hypothetical protein
MARWPRSPGAARIEAVSAAISVRMPGADIPAGDLHGLCRAVWGRIGREIQLHGQDAPWVWPILNDRLHRALQGANTFGVTMPTRDAQVQLLVTFEQDLRDLLAADAARFAFCVRANATNVAGRSIIQQQAEHAESRSAPFAVAMPRVQPRELLTRLASAGVIVQAVDGNLYVQPAELLSEADRSVLVANKAAFLEALARPAEVI